MNVKTKVLAGFLVALTASLVVRMWAVNHKIRAPGLVARPRASQHPTTTTATTTRIAPDRMRWDCGPLSDILGQSGEDARFLASLPPAERERILQELDRFELVATDEIQTSDRPRGLYFKHNELPTFQILRRDLPGDASKLETQTTKKLSIRCDNTFRIESEMPDLKGFDSKFIWQKRITIRVDWYLQPGQGIAVAAGIKGLGYAWRSDVTLTLPDPQHPPGAATTPSPPQRPPS